MAFHTDKAQGIGKTRQNFSFSPPPPRNAQIGACLRRAHHGLLHFAIEPRLRKRPQPFRGPQGDSQFPGGLLLREAREETEFHHFRGSLVDVSQSLERLIERDQLIRR